MLQTLLDNMHQGHEADHLREMARLVDFRGGDVRLDQDDVPVSKQDYPYPAFRWEWTLKQTYPWRQPQHINILELTAVLNSWRRRMKERMRIGERVPHVCDSRVTCAVVAKGRSSSRRLNHVLRRLAALMLITDTYPMMMWTISGWMPADAGSRHVTINKDDVHH